VIKNHHTPAIKPESGRIIDFGKHLNYMHIENKHFDEIVGEDLSGVTFVRDYIQLQFNLPLLLNAYTPILVRHRDKKARSGEESFANALIGQINKFVSRINVMANVSVDIIFEDGSELSISLRPEDYVGPEAVNFHRRDHSILVI
jgi:hypothetical protein